MIQTTHYNTLISPQDKLYLNRYETFVSIDRTMNEIENALSWAAPIPVIPGGIKFVVGAVQTLAGASFFVIGQFSGIASGDYALRNYSWTHVQHGVCNMVAGVLEGIPLLGAYILYQRASRAPMSDNMETTIGGLHKFKFVPYSKLVLEDICYVRGAHDKNSQASIEAANATLRVQLVNYKITSGKNGYMSHEDHKWIGLTATLNHPDKAPLKHNY